MPLEFQTALSPDAFGIPIQETPPLPQNSKMPPVVWYGYFLESPNATSYMKYQPATGSKWHESSEKISLQKWQNSFQKQNFVPNTRTR